MSESMFHLCQNCNAMVEPFDTLCKRCQPVGYTFVNSFNYTGSKGQPRKASKGGVSVKLGTSHNGTMVIEAKVSIVNSAKFSVDQIEFCIEYGTIKRNNTLINVARSMATIEGCVLASDSWHTV